MNQIQFDINTLQLKEVKITKKDIKRLSVRNSMFKPQKKGGGRS